MGVDDIKHVSVVGAGTMGRQIALNAALHGYEVELFDVDAGVREDASNWATGYLKDRVERGRLTESEAATATTGFQIADSLAEAVGDADLIIEAATEALETKRRIFAELDRLARPAAILATNSSTIVSSKLADVVGHPGRVANLHYFNPALVMTVVEVVQGPHTDEATALALLEFARRNGKTPIHLKKEIFGFVANRLLDALTREAIYLVENGYATPEEVDLAAEKALGHPMGPFRLMDLVGLDVLYLMWQQKQAETGLAQDGPPSSLADHYQRGELGRKTGRGWYDYPARNPTRSE